MTSKQLLRAELATIVRAELEAAETAHRTTMAGATHAEAKPENDKDTRALEQSYLARGQAARVQEIRDGLAEIEQMPLRSFGEGALVALGALVTVDDGEAEKVYFIAPYGGGAKLDAGKIHVITPKAPLGRALVGKREGDSCEVTLAGKPRELEITGVA